MKQIVLMFGIFALSVSCKNKENEAQQPVKEASSWEGTYVGEFPVGDCPKFITVLELRADKTYTKQEQCAEKDHQAKEEGKIELSEEGNITLTNPNGEQSFYKIKDKDHLYPGNEEYNEKNSLIRVKE